MHDDKLALAKMITKIDHELWSYKDDIALHIVERFSERFTDTNLAVEKGVITMFQDIFGHRLVENNRFPVERKVDGKTDHPEDLLLLFTEYFVGDEVDEIFDNLDCYDNHMTYISDDGFVRYDIDIAKEINSVVDKVMYDYKDSDDISLVAYNVCRAIKRNESTKPLTSNYLFCLYNISTMECIKTDIDKANFKRMIELTNSRKWKLIAEIKKPFMLIPKSFYKNHTEQLDKAYPNCLELYEVEDIPECYYSNFTRAMLYSFRNTDRLYILPVQTLKDINRFSLLSGSSSNAKQVLTCINYDFLKKMIDA